MKKIFSALVLIAFAFSLTTTAFAQVKRGVVVYHNDNKIVIATSMGYSYGNIFGYAMVYNGYNVIGNFESFGSQEIYVPYNDTSFTMWIESFWASRQQVQDWIDNGY